ncbi:Tat pathway signal protein [Streptomyces sp. NPDC091377]|uniref:Tat pathway signal protein n=1 Tax=Streptomyces sp. NPDC091377 TaxID=3365995 RepID=UPI00381169AA
MVETRNEMLGEWLEDHGMKVRELAAKVNTEIGDLTGRPGAVEPSHIYKLLRGEHRSPNSVLRTALERVTGRTYVELGFVPRGRIETNSLPPEDDPLYRRTLMTAAAAAVIPGRAEPRRNRLSSDDVAGFQAALSAWVVEDDRYGGTPEIEQHSADLARKVVELQKAHTASARIRSELYMLAAAFANNAMWAAIDGRRLDVAEQHMDKTIRLAGLSGDAATEFRVWSHACVLYIQLDRPTDALAAAERCKVTSITRSDPLFASQAMARLAVAHAGLRDVTNTRRYLDLAQKALNRAPEKRRPSWFDYYDQAELDHLAMRAHMILEQWPEAERHAHRSLSFLRPAMRRNHALVASNLATAQLHQGELEQAVATAQAIPDEMLRRPRIRRLIDPFTSLASTAAPTSPEVCDWQARYRTAVI